MAAKKRRVVAKKVKVIHKKKQSSFAVQIAIAFIIIDVVALVAYFYNSLR